MSADFIRLADGEYITIEHLTGIFIGNKYYWLSFDKADDYKIMTSDFRLVSVDA